MAFEPTPGQAVPPPEFWAEPREHARKIAAAVRQAQTGQTRNGFVVTLEDDTETVVPFPSARPGITPLLTPLNAAAATAQRTTDIWVEAKIGEIIVHHGASGAERKFALVIVG